MPPRLQIIGLSGYREGTTSSPSMIFLENVTKTYRMGETSVHALQGVSLSIEKGEFVSLIGASGSGKSTLLHVIGLLDRPESGAVSLDGTITALLSEDELAQLRSETIGFVFQQFHLLKRIDALANVELPLIYAKGHRRSADPEQLLHRVGLGARARHRPNELSGGQQQRVAIARALVRHPSIVLADEPTGNLDSQSGAEIMAILRELHAEGLTIVLVTHEPSVAALADRTIRMHDGRIVEDIRKPSTSAIPSPVSPTTMPEKAMSSQLQRDLLVLNLQQALRGLWSNKLRTFLSALGIIFGIAAVIVMMAIGRAAEADINQQISYLGSNRLMITPNAQNTGGVSQKRGAVSRITLDEALSIEGRVPTLGSVSGTVLGSVQAVHGNKNANTLLVGSFPGYEKIFASTPIYGRFFNMEECSTRARVALLGTTVLTELFGSSNPVGNTIEINHTPFVVIGVLPSRGSNGSSDNDDLIVVPLQTAMYRVLGKTYVDYIDASSAAADLVEETQRQLLQLTRTWRHIPGVQNDSYRVINMVVVAEALRGVTHTLSIMLASVAGISLLVGGIGIMNITLVSVKERTREIGLRKALGARGLDIRSQFLIEAVILCLGGGFLGIAFGWAVALTIGYFHGVWLIPSLSSVLLSCGFSVAVGVGFGYWPAVLASRLDPIEALRYE